MQEKKTSPGILQSIIGCKAVMPAFAKEKLADWTKARQSSVESITLLSITYMRFEKKKTITRTNNLERHQLKKQKKRGKNRAPFIPLKLAFSEKTDFFTSALGRFCAEKPSIRTNYSYGVFDGVWASKFRQMMKALDSTQYWVVVTINVVLFGCGQLSGRRDNRFHVHSKSRMDKKKFYSG